MISVCHVDEWMSELVCHSVSHMDELIRESHMWIHGFVCQVD